MLTTAPSAPNTNRARIHTRATPRIDTPARVWDARVVAISETTPAVGTTTARPGSAVLAGDDLRPLRCFLAVAEELSFTRAARRMGLSQPQLSRAVRRLEDQLGVALLWRTSREVALTEAGISLQAEGSETLLALERAYAGAKRNAEKAGGHIRVGWASGAAGARSSELFRTFAKRHPDIAVELCHVGWGRELTAINEGRVDVHFLRSPDIPLPGFHVERLFREGRVAAMADDHPLARRASITLADIRLEPLITVASVAKTAADWWTVDPRPDGGSPSYAIAVETAEEMFEHVAAGHGVAITGGAAAYFFPRPDIAFVPIADVESFQVSLVWRPDRETRSTRAFISVTRAVLLDRSVRSPALAGA
jgi:DNA-binding transcriptional LysR family regulator